MTIEGASITLVTDRDLSAWGKGNVRRIHALCRMLTLGGAEVSVIAPHSRGEPPAWPGVRHIGIDAPTFAGGRLSEFDPTPYARALARLRPAPDIAIASYAWMAPTLSAAPRDALRFVDLHDVLHERASRLAAAGLGSWVNCAAEEEAALLAEANGLIAISDRDRDIARELLAGPCARVATVTFSLDPVADHTLSSGAALLFVGSAHAGNLGIVNFIAHALPKIREAHPDAMLRVVGGICAALDPTPHVELFPFIEDLAGFYADAALVVAPVTCGSGVKIKTIEALAHGRALVALPEAVAGLMPTEPSAWTVAMDWDSIAASIIALLQDGAARHALERRGLDYARIHHADATALRAFCRLTEDVRA